MTSRWQPVSEALALAVAREVRRYRECRSDEPVSEALALAVERMPGQRSPRGR